MERTMQNMSNASPTVAIATNQNPHDTAVEAGLAMGVSPEEEESDDAEDLRILRQYLSEHYDLRLKKRGFAFQHHRTGNSYVLVPKEAA